MPILSSRPNDVEISDDDLLDAITPCINVLNWLAAKTIFPDSSRSSVREGQAIIQELISCFEFLDQTVTPVPGMTTTLVYEIAIRPYVLPKFVTFHATFRVKP